MNLYSKLALMLYLLIAAPVQAETLAELYEKALLSDPEYRAQQYSLEATLEARNQANAQVFLPEVSFQASGNRNYEDINATTFGSGKTNYTGYGYGLNLTQPVYHYDRYVTLKQADAEIEKAQRQLDAAEQALMIRTAERYFAVLEAQDNLIFSKAEQSALERQLEQSNERFEVGLIAITDVQEAQAGYDLSSARLIQAENLLDDNKEALKEITGQYPETLAELKADLALISPEPSDVEAWTKLALEENLELRASLLDTLISEREINRQEAGHHPSLDIVGSHGFNSTGGRFGNTEIDASRIGLELNVPIYAGGQVTSRTREALHRHQQALENLEQVRRSVERTSRDAYRGVLSGISQVKAFEQAVTSSETAVYATRTGYDVGTRTAVDVVTAEQEYFRAKKDYAQARYEYILDSLRLKQASGKLSPEDIHNVSELLENEKKITKQANS